MVHNLLTHDDPTNAQKIAKYYADIVKTLLASFAEDIPDQQRFELVLDQSLDTDFDDLHESDYDQNHLILKETAKMKKKLEEFRILLNPAYPSITEERYEIAIDIVRIREVLYNMFRKLKEYYLWENFQCADEMDAAFIEDLHQLDNVVTDIIIDGTSGEAEDMVVRLLDFLNRIELYIADFDVRHFSPPFVQIRTSSML